MKFALLKKINYKAVACVLVCGFLALAYWYYQLPNYQFKNDAVPTSEITEVKVPQPSLQPEPIYVYFNNPIANINKFGSNLDKDINDLFTGFCKEKQHNKELNY